MTYPEVLGQRLTVYGYSCQGRHSRAGLKRYLTHIVKYCGLTPVGKPVIWGYPVDGKGGYGETVFLPFGEGQVKLNWFKRWALRMLMTRFKWAFMLFQPFVESFAVLDTYPELNKIVFVMGSCIPIDHEVLTSMVRRFFGKITAEGKIGL